MFRVQLNINRNGEGFFSFFFFPSFVDGFTDFESFELLLPLVVDFSFLDDRSLPLSLTLSPPLSLLTSRLISLLGSTITGIASSHLGSLPTLLTSYRLALLGSANSPGCSSLSHLGSLKLAGSLSVSLDRAAA